MATALIYPGADAEGAPVTPALGRAMSKSQGPTSFAGASAADLQRVLEGGRRHDPHFPQVGIGGASGLSRPIITLAELAARPPHWVWCHCTHIDCAHRRAVALAPFVIRYGSDYPQARLKSRMRCQRCGKVGAAFSIPSWMDMEVGQEPFPA